MALTGVHYAKIVCKATDYMVAAPLKRGSSFCLKNQKHDTTSSLEQ